MAAREQVKPSDFFLRHPVFRHEEFAAWHSGSGDRSRVGTASVLHKHVAAGNLVNVRRGLYAVVPAGTSPEGLQVDPYLLASHLAPDAAVAYHAALQFHGKAYSVWSRFHCLTRSRGERVAFRGAEFVPVQVPAVIRGLPEFGGGIEERRHAGGSVRVTTLERTLVDVLHTPARCGDWEEIWRSLESIEYFDLDDVVEHATRRQTAVTAARVGFFLEQHREDLMVEKVHLEALRALAPAQPRYIGPDREHGRLVGGWNLVVPERIIVRSWQEVR